MSPPNDRHGWRLRCHPVRSLSVVSLTIDMHRQQVLLPCLCVSALSPARVPAAVALYVSSRSPDNNISMHSNSGSGAYQPPPASAAVPQVLSSAGSTHLYDDGRRKEVEAVPSHSVDDGSRAQPPQSAHSQPQQSHLPQHHLPLDGKPPTVQFVRIPPLPPTAASSAPSAGSGGSGLPPGSLHAVTVSAANGGHAAAGSMSLPSTPRAIAAPNVATVQQHSSVNAQASSTSAPSSSSLPTSTPGAAAASSSSQSAFTAALPAAASAAAGAVNGIGSSAPLTSASSVGHTAAAAGSYTSATSSFPVSLSSSVGVGGALDSLLDGVSGSSDEDSQLRMIEEESEARTR